jgi:IMP dehydrogenase
MLSNRKELDRAWSFDDVAIVPGAVTTNPQMVNPKFSLGSFEFNIPIIASAMDAVVDVEMAVKLTKLGAAGVLNLEGIQTRYEDTVEIFDSIAESSNSDVTSLMQKIYSKEINLNLISKRVEDIKNAGGIAIVSATPQNTKQFAPIAKDAGVDIFVVQSTVTTANHVSRSLNGLKLKELVNDMGNMPILVGNTVDFDATLELLETGINGILVGVGPGAACTSREVLGIGMPQVSATIETSHARNTYFEKTGRYVPIITDGGIRTGGDFSKAICAGANAVMIGSPFASTTEAPGKGYHWGMATPHVELPRGTRVHVGQDKSLDTLLFGPTSLTNGTENLIGALKTSMSTCGATTIEEFHNTRMIIAPAIKTEGKIYQMKDN